ncbi:Shewanella-like protein phosphatase 2 [Bienertia sinuspersici]
MAGDSENQTCKNLHNLLSSFVDTFVDFSVSGLFLPPPPSNSNLNTPFDTFYPSPDRLIAVGDVHGDLEKCKQSLLLAGIIDGSGNWSGGSSTVVQIGDVLDRGGDEIKILYFLERLKRQADKSGGKIITMHGNHEIMNIDGDFRFITIDSLKEFSDWAFWYNVGDSMKRLCSGIVDLQNDPFRGVPMELKGIRKEFHDGFKARIVALRPNGPLSTRFLANNMTVLVMGENVFVHGGLLANHVNYGLERINKEVRDWINGVRRDLWRDIGRGRDSVVWLRRFSHELAESCDCEALEHVLTTIPGVKRMIMGHTIQGKGINGACQGKAIRIDVGMSRGCINGLPEVLEIANNAEVRVLTANPAYRDSYGARVVRSGGRGLGILLEEDRRKQVEPIVETYYEILHVAEDASYEEIRRSYRVTLLQCHPDKLHASLDLPNSGEAIEDRFMKVQKAWEILGDSRSRALYDNNLRSLRCDELVADDVSLEEMMVEDVGEPLGFCYECRCGDYFCVSWHELEEMGHELCRSDKDDISVRTANDIPGCVILPCSSCSLKIRLLINTGCRVKL